MNKFFIQVPQEQPSRSQGITLTLANTGVFLGILLSICGLATIFTKIVSKMNELTSSLEIIKNQLQSYSQTINDVRQLDKKLDIHLQDYTNRKDTITMLINQINEKIDHKFDRVNTSVKEVERYLQSSSNFKIRKNNPKQEES